MLNYCYAKNEDEIEINIQTGEDVVQVFLVYGDPYEGGILGGAWKWKGVKTEIIQRKALHHHLWWSMTVKPEFKRCKYYFQIVFNNGAVLNYYENGSVYDNDVNYDNYKLQEFVFPWLNSSDINTVPEWASQTIWYQIFIDRFNSSNPESKIHDAQYQSVNVTNYERYGGDLKGIIHKIDYLKDLGISGIYLTPVFSANSMHKYDVKDYTQVDEMFGNNEDLLDLVKAAHQKGIKVMLDAVFNHTSRDFFAWQDVLINKEASEYYDWYFINDMNFSEHSCAHKKEYFSFAFLDDMPKINTNHPKVIDYFCEVCTNWIKAYDIDGIRVDVGNEVSHTFLRKLRQAIKATKKDIYFIGEVWHDAVSWLQGDQYDAVMNYPLQSLIHDFCLNPSVTSAHFEKSVNTALTSYMSQTNKVLFNLLDSHDTKRLINACEFNTHTFFNQIALLLVMPGSVCFYYGTEVLLKGEHDPDNRRVMPWSLLNDESIKEYLSHFKALLSLRNNYLALCSDEYRFIIHQNNPRVIEIHKYHEQQSIAYVLNSGMDNYVIEDMDCIYSYLLDGNCLIPGGFVFFKI